MKFTKKILASAVLLATSSLAIAATQTAVEINVTKGVYLSFTGSLAASPKLGLNVSDISGGAYTLGDLGFASNIAGNCKIAFSSAHDYTLLHESGDPSINLGVYILDYAGTTNTAGTNNVYSTTTGCNQANQALTITHDAIPQTVAQGVYQDILTMEVTVQ